MRSLTVSESSESLRCSLLCLAANLHPDHERALQPGRRLHRCASAILSARWERERGGFPLNALFLCRNPGVDFGAERWNVDEFSYPLCSGKRQQVEHGELWLAWMQLQIKSRRARSPTADLFSQLRGGQNAPGSDQAAGASVFHPGGQPNGPGLHHHQVPAAQH